MVDAQDLTNIDQKGIAFTIRSVFVIDPNKKIRLTMMYPASTGRNTREVLRVVDSLQTGDKKGVTTPIDWVEGDDVMYVFSDMSLHLQAPVPKLSQILQAYRAFVIDIFGSTSSETKDDADSGNTDSVPPTVSTTDARKKFGDVREIKP